jgi:enamine deaminase RidA (YjgF/YER057c/UK114 family)
MNNLVANRLADLGISLPKPTPAAGTYSPYVISGNLIYISGQVPVGASGLEFQGKLGDAYSVADGQAAARLCAINILAQLSGALGGDLDLVTQCVKLGGFINSTPDFGEHPAVMNGASDLMVDVFGEIGRHARFAVGAPSLPFDVAVEVEAIFEID